MYRKLIEEKRNMQGTLATILLLTAAVVLTCVVIDYAVNVVEQTVGTTNLPQLDRIRNLENSVLNQTDALANQMQTVNGTLASPP